MKSATYENVNVIYLGNGIMIPAEQQIVYAENVTLNFA